MAYLNNAWYCAGWAGDLGRTPMAKTFLDQSVLMYRREDGTPVAVSNRCPHRFAPLHKGKLAGDRIECPYHGLQYDHDGACVLNPHLQRPRRVSPLCYRRPEGPLFPRGLQGAGR